MAAASASLATDLGVRLVPCPVTMTRNNKVMCETSAVGRSVVDTSCTRTADSSGRWSTTSGGQAPPEEAHDRLLLCQMPAPSGLLTPNPTPMAMPMMSMAMSTLTMIRLRLLRWLKQLQLRRLILAAFALRRQWSLPGHI